MSAKISQYGTTYGRISWANGVRSMVARIDLTMKKNMLSSCPSSNRREMRLSAILVLCWCFDAVTGGLRQSDTYLGTVYFSLAIPSPPLASFQTKTGIQRYRNLVPSLAAVPCRGGKRRGSF